MSGHTKGPWSIDPDNGDIVAGPRHVCIPHAMSTGDKRRAIACVNALEGLDPAAVADVVAALEPVAGVAFFADEVDFRDNHLALISVGTVRAARTALARIRGEG